MKKLFAEIFASKTKEEWTRLFEGSDACVAPVVQMSEVDTQSHLRARQSFIRDQEGSVQPAPAPKLSRTPANTSTPSYPESGQHTFEVLQEFAFPSRQVLLWKEEGVIDQLDTKASL